MEFFKKKWEWSRDLPKKFWAKCCRYAAAIWRKLDIGGPITLVVLGYALFLWVIMKYFAEPSGFFTDLTIKSWDDRRSFGLAIAGLLAPPIALIGYILSAYRTNTMEADNKIKQESQHQTAYSAALNTIDNDGLSSVGAIGEIAQIGCTNKSYTQPAKDVLIAVLRKRAGETGADSKRAGGDKFILHIEAALNGLSALQIFSREHGEKEPFRKIHLNNLDFSKIKLKEFTDVSDIRFIGCDFTEAKLENLNFNQITFQSCKFSAANFFGSNLGDTIISGSDFEGVTEFYRDQLSDCRYCVTSPPKNLPRTINYKDLPINGSSQDDERVEAHIKLASPFLCDSIKENSGHHCTQREANEQGSTSGNDRLSDNSTWLYTEGNQNYPKDNNGESLTIVWPDGSETTPQARPTRRRIHPR